MQAAQALLAQALKATRRVQILHLAPSHQLAVVLVIEEDLHLQDLMADLAAAVATAEASAALEFLVKDTQVEMLTLLRRGLVEVLAQ